MRVQKSLLACILGCLTAAVVVRIVFFKDRTSQDQFRPEHRIDRDSSPGALRSNLIVKFTAAPDLPVPGDVEVVLEGPHGQTLKNCPAQRGCSFEGIADGQYTLEVRQGRCIALPRNLKLRLAPGETRVVNIVLRGQRTISGTVTGIGSEPLAEVDFSIPDFLEWTKVPLKHGQYNLLIPDETLPRESTLMAQAPGYARHQREIRLLPSRDLQGIDFVLGHGGKISGRVVGPDGQPLREALVSLFSKGHRDSVRTSVDGCFEILGCHLCRYDISAHAEGFISSSKELLLTKERSVHVVEFALTQGWRIRGFVYGPNSEMMEGAKVRAMNASAFSNKDGFFDLTGIRPTPSGLIRSVSAESEGYGEETFYNVVPDSTLTFRLKKTTQVRFQLTNVPEGFRKEVNVKFLVPNASGGIQPERAYTSSVFDGNSVKELNLPEGTYDVVAVVFGIRVARKTGVIVGASDDGIIRIDLSHIDLPKLERAENVYNQIRKEMDGLTRDVQKITEEQRQQLQERLERLNQELNEIRRTYPQR